MYLSATTEHYFKDPENFGCMFNSSKVTGRQWEALDAGCIWMLDNGAFSGKFTLQEWLRALIKFAPYAENCRGVILPDAVILDEHNNFERGDWVKTLARLQYYRHFVTAVDLPVAYALQDDHPIGSMPWGLIDTVAIAGRTKYKFSAECEHIALEAHKRSKHVHCLRANSSLRIRKVHYAQTFDGGRFRYGQRDEGERSIRRGLDKCREYFQLRIL